MKRVTSGVYTVILRARLISTPVLSTCPLHTNSGCGKERRIAGRPGSSEVPRNPLTRWDVSSIPANGIFLIKKLKNKTKNAQRVEND